MSDIHILRAHHMTLAAAKKAVQQVADDLAQEHDLESEWKGNTLHFSRSGVDGTIRVAASEIEIDVRLGFLLRAFRSSFERHIVTHLDEHLRETALAAGKGTGKKA